MTNKYHASLLTSSARAADEYWEVVHSGDAQFNHFPVAGALDAMPLTVVTSATPSVIHCPPSTPSIIVQLYQCCPAICSIDLQYTLHSQKMQFVIPVTRFGVEWFVLTRLFSGS